MGKNSEVRIEKIIKKTVDETLRAYHETSKREARRKTYYQKTEELLYAYPALKQHLEQQGADIEDMKKEGVKHRSACIVLYSPRSGEHKNKEERFEEYLQERLKSYERTEREVRRIEGALYQIKDHEWYPIIEKRYFEGKSIEEIAEEMTCSESTVKRHRRRLVNRLKIILFGADAINDPLP